MPSRTTLNLIFKIISAKLLNVSDGDTPTSKSRDHRAHSDWRSKRQTQSNHSSQSQQKKVNRKPVIKCASKTTEQPEARENAGDQVAIGLNFEFDWFRNRRHFSGPIKKWGKAIPKESRITLKIVLWTPRLIQDDVRFQKNCSQMNCPLSLSLDAGYADFVVLKVYLLVVQYKPSSIFACSSSLSFSSSLMYFSKGTSPSFTSKSSSGFSSTLISGSKTFSSISRSPKIFFILSFLSLTLLISASFCLKISSNSLLNATLILWIASWNYRETLLNFS